MDLELAESVRHLPVLVLPNVPGLVLRPIPAGKYMVGSRGHSDHEEPRIEVELRPIAQNLPAFWMADAPVTQAQFALWTETADYADWRTREAEAGRDNSAHKNHFTGRPDHPAENLNWFEAREYCAWLQRNTGAQFQTIDSRPWKPPVALRFDLPGEVAWEVACRAGTTTDYHSGDGEAALLAAGWYDEQLEKGSTHPIRTRQSNSWGLFDMYGNVWEWCSDEWLDSPYRSRVDELEDLSICHADRGDRQAGRVFRGGSWGVAAGFCRSAYRGGGVPGDRYGSLGFRVCLLPGPVVQPATSPAEAQDAGRARGGTTRSRPQSRAGAAGAPPRATPHI